MMEINTEYQTTFTVKNVVINEDLFSKLLGVNQKPKWSFYYDHQIQRRKHRKKRINKKWAKRYGYRNVMTKIGLEEFNITEDSHDINQVTFIGKIKHD